MYLVNVYILKMKDKSCWHEPSAASDAAGADVTDTDAAADDDGDVNGDVNVNVMSTLSSEASRIFFFRIFSAAVSCVGDFHILLNGRNAMLSGRRGPAVAEKRLPYKE